MIAYYAHSHGFGHSNSGQEFCREFPLNSFIITSSNYVFDSNVEVLKICDENTKPIQYNKTTYNLPRYAHYLPKSKSKILFRNFQILESCISEDVKLALIDVSVETAIQFRIAGIPYAYHKMLGLRADLAHHIAYEASEFLFAFYPREMEVDNSNLIIEKTHYLGFISRFKFRLDRNLDRVTLENSLKILIITGRGGTKLTSEIITKICLQSENHQFTVIGNQEDIIAKNAVQLQFSHDIESIIADHDIVISSCGLNLTSEILSLKNKFIAFAENRPYNEQNIILDGLVDNNLAVRLNYDNFEQTLIAFFNLKGNVNLKLMFGTMSKFNNIEIFKQYLK
ncbi:MAG: hypothetical protein WA775_14780 [Psychroserpens sp.]|uniref:hypothetical protein n=1 Tax=Psychroserpens sp. TaxID=2020870 RepID=UPI003C769026